MKFYKIKKVLKKNKLVYFVYLKCRKSYIKYKEKVDSALAITNLEKQRKMIFQEPVTVIFVVQDLNVWNKSRPIFEEIKKDSRFKTYLLCVPSWYGDSRIISNRRSNDTYEIIHSAKNEGTGIINSIIGKNNWYDIRDIKPSYVFYTRPYDEYLPRIYRSYIVSAYSRVCYTRYGGGPLLSYDFLGLSKNFRRFCSIYLAATEDEANYNRIENNKIFDTGLAKSVSVGCPVLKDFVKTKNEPSKVWKFSKNRFRVLWTPRWTTDEYVGGTNFIRYKDKFLNLIESNQDVDFVVRPHPLMFGNLLNTGEMSEEEVNHFKKHLDTSLNALLDESKEYGATLWNSSVFITDYSSLISMFFMTETPIIYCPSEHSAFKNSKIFERILEVNYIAYSFDDVEKFFELIKKGNDLKKEERTKAKIEIFGNDYLESPMRIKNVIVEDYNERRNR